MTTKAKKSSNAGRNPIYSGEPMGSRTYRLTDRQAEKLHRLGGAAWLRKKIDEAKEK